MDALTAFAQLSDAEFAAYEAEGLDYCSECFRWFPAEDVMYGYDDTSICEECYR